ncbi:MAG: tRNA (5-methylaminomethyl-2-thiouridine)(34)-methyltransferase MnmD [Bacteroidota bacterium]
MLKSTADGSWSAVHPHFAAEFHSRYGALREAQHVFGTEGFFHWRRLNPSATQVRVAEMGLGTGLNAVLTRRWAAQEGLELHYEAWEAYPLPEDEREAYADRMGWTPAERAWLAGLSLHTDPVTLLSPLPAAEFDLVYYDAFGPGVQREFWAEAMLHRWLDLLRPGGIWVTYCAQGVVRRALAARGWRVDRPKGPPGKREMLRVVRPLIP